MKPKSVEVFIPGPAGRLEGNVYKNPKHKLLIISNVGSVVEFSPATREARVRFPDVAFLQVSLCL